MEKIKSFFSSLGGILVAILSVVGAVLAYVFIRKQEENEALKAKLNLANTQKEVDVLEVEIKQKAAERELNAKEQAAVDRDLAAIEEKRKAIKTTATDQEIEDFWSAKKDGK